jgi:hypothetical protein
MATPEDVWWLRQPRALGELIVAAIRRRQRLPRVTPQPARTWQGTTAVERWFPAKVHVVVGLAVVEPAARGLACALSRQAVRPLER